jgi:dienelactone hydrolase
MSTRSVVGALGLLATLQAAALPIDVNLMLDSSGFGGAGTFSGILREGAGAPDVGVILLHGRGAQPNGRVVGPLRHSLNDLGYTTLSIALPVPADTDGDPGATDFQDYVNDVNGPDFAFPELYARVHAAQGELASRGVDEVVLIGFSLGSRMGAAFLARGAPGPVPVIAYAGIGMYANSIDPLNTSLTLDEIGIPVLDLFGSLDTPAVTDAAARAAAYDFGPGVSYTQVVVPQSGPLPVDDAHQFDNIAQPEAQVNQTRMRLEVASWISRVAPLTAPDSFSLLGLGLALWLIARVSPPRSRRSPEHRGA